MLTLPIIKIDDRSRTPKYRQVVERIIDNIISGRIGLNEKIPSINSLSEECFLSRDTVEKAYNILKEQRIITSVKGKGFYVTGSPQSGTTKVLFLVNKLSTYKMAIYNAFIDAMGEDGSTDLHVYHCDETLFLNALRSRQKVYDYYVVMPHFKTKGLRHVSTTEQVSELLRQIPEHKLIVLDNHQMDFQGNFAEVYQDFQEDLYEALMAGREKIARYRKMVIAYPSKAIYPYPRRILRGFRKFCVETAMPFEVIDEIAEDHPLEPGTLYLTVPEGDLVNLVKSARDQGLRPGKDIGIISYNETPLKNLLGITTVSTDFARMGRTTAEIVLRQGREKVKNPFRLLHRDSL